METGRTIFLSLTAMVVSKEQKLLRLEKKGEFPQLLPYTNLVRSHISPPRPAIAHADVIIELIRNPVGHGINFRLR